jgi:hypothetical protein
VFARGKGRVERATGVFVVAGIALGGLSWSASAREQTLVHPPPTCAYHELGAPGPADNELAITEPEFGTVQLQRSGQEILVINRPPGMPPATTPCTGPQATVENIDRVLVTIPAQDPTEYTFFWLDESGGLLGPGATPEADGQSEIEVDVEPTSEAAVLYIKLFGQPGPDQQTIAGGQDQLLQADLNADQPGQDPELTARYASFLEIYGASGDDAISVPNPGAVFEHASIKGEAGNDTLSANAADVAGGAGDDVIIGGYWGEFLRGDAGRDRIYGGKGFDHLGGNKGNDYLNGGPGRDVLRGGAGKDKLHGGPGRDRQSQ